MCGDSKRQFRGIDPGAQAVRLDELERDGLQVIDYSTLRAPDPEFVESADRFLDSISRKPLTREEVLGSWAVFFKEVSR